MSLWKCPSPTFVFHLSSALPNNIKKTVGQTLDKHRNDLFSYLQPSHPDWTKCGHTLDWTNFGHTMDKIHLLSWPLPIATGLPLAHPRPSQGPTAAQPRPTHGPSMAQPKPTHGPPRAHFQSTEGQPYETMPGQILDMENSSLPALWPKRGQTMDKIYLLSWP